MKLMTWPAALFGLTFGHEHLDCELSTCRVSSSFKKNPLEPKQEDAHEASEAS